MNAQKKDEMRTAHILLRMVFWAALACSSRAELSDGASSTAALVERYALEFTTPTNLDAIGPFYTEYRDQFLERLRKTEDQELKRLLVLSGLCSEIESEIRDLASGRVPQGKSKLRKMTKDERIHSETYIREMLRDLTVLDPTDAQGVIAKLTARLRAAVDKRK